MTRSIRQTLQAVDIAERLALYDSIVQERDEYRRQAQAALDMLRTLVFACLQAEYDAELTRQPATVRSWTLDDYYLFLISRLPVVLNELRAIAASVDGKRSQDLQARLLEYEARLEQTEQELDRTRDRLASLSDRHREVVGEMETTRRKLAAAEAAAREAQDQVSHLTTKFADYRQMVQSTVAAIQMASGVVPAGPGHSALPQGTSAVLTDPQRRLLTVMGSGLCRQRAIMQAAVDDGLPRTGLKRWLDELEVLGMVVSTVVSMGSRQETVWQLTPAGRQVLGNDSPSEVDALMPVCATLEEAVFRLEAADALLAHGAISVERRPAPITVDGATYVPHLVAELDLGRVPILCILAIPPEEHVLNVELDRYAAICQHYYVVCPDNNVMRAAIVQIHEHRGPGSRRRMWMTHLMRLADAPADTLWIYANR